MTFAQQGLRSTSAQYACMLFRLLCKSQAVQAGNVCVCVYVCTCSFDDRMLTRKGRMDMLEVKR